jgi:hypothetical protein
MGQARANGSGNRLLDQMRFASARAHRRVINRTLLHFRHTARNADDNTRARDRHPALLMGLGDEVVQHPFGDFKLRDHAIAQGADDQNMRWRFAAHFFGFLPIGYGAASLLFDSRIRGFIDHYPFTANADQRISRTQINANIQ